MTCHRLNDRSLSPSLLPKTLTRSYLPHVPSICPHSYPSQSYHTCSSIPQAHALINLYGLSTFSPFFTLLFQAADSCVICAHPFPSLVSTFQWPPLEKLCMISLSVLMIRSFLEGSPFRSVCQSGANYTSLRALTFSVISHPRARFLSCLSHDYRLSIAGRPLNYSKYVVFKTQTVLYRVALVCEYLNGW